MTEVKHKWKTHNSTVVYENAWIKVAHDEVTTPSGTQGVYGTVLFKNKAIGIIPIDEDGNTWLVGQYRYPLQEYSWEIPMGGGPHDELPLDCAKRELKEETGIEAEKWTNLMKIHTSNCVTNEVGFIFLAEHLTYGETAFDETEDLVIKKLPFKEVYRMVLDNEITDSSSVAGILFAAKKMFI
jgi:8-oxo-dGTP pyrophosphatase MutT (NUDIX family)